jgi:DNA-binding SARP family transcriptional activator
MPSRRDGLVSRTNGAPGRAGHRAPTPELRLLGGFELVLHGLAGRPPLHVQKLLGFLALQRRPLQRAYVAGHLWFDLSQEQANGCLRSTLWRMSRFPRPLVEVTATHLALDPSVSVDVRELEACVQRALHGGAPPARADVERLTRAGELMPDWYDDWILQERDRLRQVRLLALESAGEALLDAARYSEGAIAALAAVDADPLRESAYRLLIRAYVGAGNVAEALHQYAVFQGRIDRQLGLAPSPQMVELVARIT